VTLNALVAALDQLLDQLFEIAVVCASFIVPIAL
jgi:hypothetical protein